MRIAAAFFDTNVVYVRSASFTKGRTNLGEINLLLG